MRDADPRELDDGEDASCRSALGPRILLGVTADTSLRLMAGFPEYLRNEGWEVHVVSAPGKLSTRLGESGTVSVHTISMKREPSIYRDTAALVQWVCLLRRIRPHVVSVGTPKAGLLGILAAWLTRVPVRIYLLRGIRFETATGHRRKFLKCAERIVCSMATEVVAISTSLRSVALQEEIAHSENVTVVGNGSSNGVAVTRFATERHERRRAQDDRWRASRKSVLGYIGRIAPDKGIDLLAEAMEILVRSGRPIRLLVIGGADSSESDSLRRKLEDSGIEVDFVGQVEDVAPYLKLIDLLCFPTKREGFGNVIIEAAAASVPTVATMATGVVDAIVDGVTGTIVQSRDPKRFAAAISFLLDNHEIRDAMGEAALKRAQELYSQEIVWRNYANFYESRLPGVSMMRPSDRRR